MQTDTILQLFAPFIQKEIAKLSEELSNTWDFRQFEDGMMNLMNQLEAILTVCILEDCLSDPAFLTLLKLLGSKLGMRFQEYRTLRIRLCNGLRVTISSPYFLKTKPKRGRKKRAKWPGKTFGLKGFGYFGESQPRFSKQNRSNGLVVPFF